MRPAWQCETCWSNHHSPEQAQSCEDQHRVLDPDKLQLKLGSRSPRRPGPFYQDIPETVTVKFSDNHGDFATYRLERYGFKGM
jgi:hypothetical protein